MRNKLIIIFFIFSFIFFINTISYGTATGTVYLESNKQVVEKEEEIEISVNLKDAKTAAFSFWIYFDEAKFDYVSNIENANKMENRIVYVWYDTLGGKGAKDGELVKFKFKAKENGTATFSMHGEFYNSVGQKIQTDFAHTQVQVGKEETSLQVQAQEEHRTNSNTSNANLQNLRLDIEGIAPIFEENVYEYYLTIPNNITSIDVLAVSQNPNANIEVIGNNNLKEGLNTIKIIVTSEDKTKQNIYTIQVTKTANLELANTNLETLAIENVWLNPPFDNIETNYKTEVSNLVENLNILAIPQNEKASVKIEGKENLKVGNNLVTVIVTAQNGFTKRKYQIEVYRRNEQEEQLYKKEQQQMHIKLEEAYEIEKTNSNTNTNQATNSNVAIWIIISVVTIVVCAVLGYLYWKRKKQKS